MIVIKHLYSPVVWIQDLQSKHIHSSMLKRPNYMVMVRLVDNLIRLTQVSRFSNTIRKTVLIVLNRKQRQKPT